MSPLFSKEKRPRRAKRKLDKFRSISGQVDSDDGRERVKLGPLTTIGDLQERVSAKESDCSKRWGGANIKGGVGAPDSSCP